MDAYAIEQLHVPGYTLMTRAAEAALTTLRSEWPTAMRLIVMCGFGNNAGDGYVLARLAMSARMQVYVVALGDPAQLPGDAQRAWRDFAAMGGVAHPWHAEVLQHAQADGEADVIVDALLGTGLSRALSGELLTCVQAINQVRLPVLALDVPTGLDADTGAVLGAAVCAHRTITFVGLKQGFYLAQGPDHVGKLLFDDLEIPSQVAEQVGCVARRLDNQIVQRALPRRSRTTHKGQQGHVVIVGGGLGMPGAVRLCGEACLRVGAGLVTVATRPEHVSALMAGRPELMCRGVMSAQELVSVLQPADVIAIGPGLSQDAWARQLFAAAIEMGKPMIVDADALNLLATQPMRRDDWVLTPHPGEAARLLSSSTSAVQGARMLAVHELAERYGGTIVLKGAGTLVWQEHATLAVCDRGNPGMAAPGMGDVLTGIVAGIAAQQTDVAAGLNLAAQAGVYVHAVAGDMAARHGERGLLASDLFTYLPSCVNP